MRKTIILLLVSMVLAFTWAYAGEVTKTGTISDIDCAQNPDKNAGSPSHAGCARGCIGNGAEAVLVSDGKYFKLAPQDKVKEFAGDQVTVVGTLADEVITVSSIKKSE